MMPQNCRTGSCQSVLDHVISQFNYVFLLALWNIKDYSGSLKTLVTPNIGLLHPKYDDNDILKKKKSENAVADPSVFNFYVYLRTHPLIQRHNLTSKKAELKKQASSIGKNYALKKYDQFAVLQFHEIFD